MLTNILLFEEFGSESGERIEDLDVIQFTRRGFGKGAEPLPRAHQHRYTADQSGGQDVLGCVAYESRPCHRGRKLGFDLPQQAGLWFATLAAFIRAVGPEKHTGDVPASLFDHAAHLLVHMCQLEFVEVLAGDAGLVAGPHHGEAGGGKPGDGLNAAGNGDPLVSGLDVVVGVLVDDTVPVQNDQIHKRGSRLVAEVSCFAGGRYPPLPGTTVAVHPAVQCGYGGWPDSHPSPARHRRKRRWPDGSGPAAPGRGCTRVAGTAAGSGTSAPAPRAPAPSRHLPAAGCCRLQHCRTVPPSAGYWTPACWQRPATGPPAMH